MKKASQILYVVGRIENILNVPVSIFVFFYGFYYLGLGALSVANHIMKILGYAEFQNGNWLAYADKYLLQGAIIVMIGILLFIISIVSLVICKEKFDEIENGNQDIIPRVYLITLGFFGGNNPYILSGIFSLIARNRKENDLVEDIEEVEDNQKKSKFEKSRDIIFIIGKVFNLILILLGIFLVVGGIYVFYHGIQITVNGAIESLNDEDFVYRGWGDEALYFIFRGIFYFFYGLFIFVFSIISIVLCSKKFKIIKEDKNNTSPMNFLIIFGMIGSNMFYVLTGIFSLILRVKSKKRIQNNFT